MALDTTENRTSQITIRLPGAILKRMNELVPARQRSRFVSEAVTERLALLEQVVALDESAGAWSDENHPEMQDEEAIDRWLTALRSSWQVTTPPVDDSVSA
jgi:predicted transcriptional regulator